LQNYRYITDFYFFKFCAYQILKLDIRHNSLINLILKLKRQIRLLTYVNSYSETFSAGSWDALVKGKIWVIYRKFSDKLPVNYR